MKKFTFILTFILFISVHLMAQDDDFYSAGDSEKNNGKKNDHALNLDKWNFGGNFWMSFSSDFAYIEASPVALYKATPRLLIGPGITYRYNKTKALTNLYLNEYETFSYHSFGPRAVASYTLFQNISDYIPINIGNIIAYSEYEMLNIKRYDYTINGDIIFPGRGWVNNWLVGGGIYQPFGERGGGIYMLLLYDVTQSKYSPYSNPDIRIGFYF